MTPGIEAFTKAMSEMSMEVEIRDPLSWWRLVWGPKRM